MNISKCLLICIFSVAFFNTLYPAKPAAPAPTAPAAGMPPMSNEEQVLAQQLDSVFEELTKGMSETEKNQFFNELNTAMEEEIDKMSKMSDEELNKYIQDAEKELQNLGTMPEPGPQAQPVAQPAAQAEPAKPVEPLIEEPKKPSRDMVPTIDEIVARLDSFIQKANQIVEISSKFEKWGKKGKLHGWNPIMSWAVFKEKIESLKKTLLAIKSLDPKTQKPKYLVDLAANESLCNNINQFRTVLAKHEPNTQAPSFGLKKLGKASKSAFVAVINDCLEALLALNLQAELEKIIAKYEPTAKKIKEAEEKAQQAALEASKRRATTPGAIKTTVRHGEQAGYYEFGVPGKPGYADYGAIPSYIPEKKAEPEDKAGTSKGGGAKQEGKGPEAAKKEEKKGPESKKEDVKETETTKKVENLYYEFEGSLDDILDTLKQLPNLQNLKSKLEHSQDPKELDNIARELNNLSSMVRSARKKVKDAGNRIADLGKGPQHDKWVTNFKTGWASYRGEFVHLRDLLLQHSY